MRPLRRRAASRRVFNLSAPADAFNQREKSRLLRCFCNGVYVFPLFLFALSSRNIAKNTRTHTHARTQAHQLSALHQPAQRAKLFLTTPSPPDSSRGSVCAGDAHEVREVKKLYSRFETKTICRRFTQD